MKTTPSTPADIVTALPKVKREGWVNIYQNMVYGRIVDLRIHNSKSEADYHELSSRLACTRIEWEE